MRNVKHIGKAAVAAVVTLAVIVFLSGCSHSASANAPTGNSSATNSAQSVPTVDLSASQLNSIKIEPVGSYAFPVEKEAVATSVTLTTCRSTSFQRIRER